jgi:hypothetical protein
LPNELQPVYNYIENSWKKSKSELSAAYYNIEECFSLLQLQIRDAKKLIIITAIRDVSLP